jgi:hypothetical protein
MKQTSYALGWVLVSVFSWAGLAPGPVLDPTDMSEGNALHWGSGATWGGLDITQTVSVADDSTKAKAGQASIRVSTPLEYGGCPYAVFPKTRSANWDLSGTTALEFWIWVEAPSGWNGWSEQGRVRVEHSPAVRLGNSQGGFYQYIPMTSVGVSGTGWVKVTIPLIGEGWKREELGEVSLSDIDYVEIFGHKTFWVDGLRFTPTGLGTGQVVLGAADLDVLWIERSPEYSRDLIAYPLGYPMVTNLSEKREPVVGEAVTFTAHVANKGGQGAGAFNLVWSVDGVAQRIDAIPSLAAGGVTTSTFGWVWQAGSHTVTCAVDTADQVAESCRENNVLTDWTDAWSFHFKVEQDEYDLMNQAYNGLGSKSTEDWLQLVVRHIHQMFEEARYDFAPIGGMGRHASRARRTWESRFAGQSVESAGGLFG